MHGKGIHTYTDGNAYDGEWEDDKEHGRGILIMLMEMFMMVNEWKDDKKHEKGFFNYVGGEKIDGVWNDDELLSS